METFAQACAENTGAILVMLGTAFGFGVLLGYAVWYKYIERAREHARQREEWREKYVDRDAEYQTLDLDHQKVTADHRNLRNAHTSLESELRGVRADLDLARLAGAGAAAGGAPTRARAATDYIPADTSVPRKEHESLRKQYEALEVAHASTKAELDMLTKRMTQHETQAASAKTHNATIISTPDVAANAPDPSTVFQASPDEPGSRNLPANLVAMLHAKHIYDWPDLAALEPDELQTLLASEDHFFVPAQFSAWIAQARRMVGDARPVGPVGNAG